VRSFAAVAADPVKRNDVLAAEVVEEIPDAAADELQRTGRQDSGLDDAPHDELRQVARGRRGLHDRRHAGEQCRREFFKHSPDREVERVDVHGGALERHADVLADECAAPGESLERAIEVDAAVREFARALAREHEHRADAAVDVDPGVALRCAGAVRELIELRLEVEQALAERAQDGGAFVERQRAQRRPADLARVCQRGPKIEALAHGFGNRRTGARIPKEDRPALAALPGPCQVTLQAHRSLRNHSRRPGTRAACQAASVPPSPASVTSRPAGVQ
jgi:hypothetical protein